MEAISINVLEREFYQFYLPDFQFRIGLYIRNTLSRIRYDSDNVKVTLTTVLRYRVWIIELV